MWKSVLSDKLAELEILTPLPAIQELRLQILFLNLPLM